VIAIRRTVLLAVAFCLLCIVLNVISLNLNRTISNNGRIRAMGLEVWQNANGTNALISIAWGSIPPNYTFQHIAYVQNINESTLSLHMNISDWSPANASGYLSCVWNSTAVLVAPGAIVPVKFELTATNDAPRGTVFSFNINIWPESAE
jgi:hypothetical protein